MDYTDPLYGNFEINESVLLDLINTSAIQRLQGVLQHGISGLIGITRATTRYEHSMGVMLLVRRLGAGLKDQIAALLHDVSHTAFSHVIDYVFDGHNSQSYHEEQKEAYIARSDLPATLVKYGYNWRDFLNEESFPLLEQPSPALCADRLDYFLRDSRDLGLATDEQIRTVLEHLVVYNQKIVVDDLPAACWLANTFLDADEASWANFREVGIYELTAQAIKLALKVGVLTDEDIWTTDQAAWMKLQTNTYPELEQIIRQISPLTHFVWDEVSPTFRVSTKLRTIDPPVVLDGRLYLLSDLDSDYSHRRNTYLRVKSGFWPVRVIPLHDQQFFLH
jgi:uncharacterized protein